MRNKQTIVCQIGARRRYAMPRIFENAGCLAAFYTDSTVYSRLGRFAQIAPSWSPKKLQRLLNRKVHGVPPSKIYTTDLAAIKAAMLRNLYHYLNYKQKPLLEYDFLSSTMRKWGVQNASNIYSMALENLTFVQWAKRKGLKVIIDLVISPLNDKIMAEEEEKFPCWKKGERFDWQSMKATYQYNFDLADYLLCPSEWVAQGVIAISPESEKKIRVVPYGSSISYGHNRNIPTLGRVFFAGGNPIRKGVWYLGQASQLLHETMEGLDFRVAGNFDTQITADKACSGLNFIGKLSSVEMQKEFLSADVFVLPSVCEGLPAVVAEAISAGCPVVVTKESGCPIKHEREGLIVPARNEVKLAEAIKRLLQDRKLREECSVNCLQMRSFFSEREWEKRLFSALDFT